MNLTQHLKRLKGCAEDENFASRFHAKENNIIQMAVVKFVYTTLKLVAPGLNHCTTGYSDLPGDEY